MHEYVTEALVLGVCGRGEHDRTVHLFTRALGRVEARVAGGRKILSKFAPHLNPFNFVLVRLVRKNGFTLADAITLDRLRTFRTSGRRLYAGLELLFLLRLLLPVLQPDMRLWHYTRQSLARGVIRLRVFLKMLGYDPAFAVCELCSRKAPCFFSLADQNFVCSSCSTKVPANELLSIR